MAVNLKNCLHVSTPNRIGAVQESDATIDQSGIKSWQPKTNFNEEIASASPRNKNQKQRTQ